MASAGTLASLGKYRGERQNRVRRRRSRPDHQELTAWQDGSAVQREPAAGELRPGHWFPRQAARPDHVAGVVAATPDAPQPPVALDQLGYRGWLPVWNHIRRPSGPVPADGDRLARPPIACRNPPSTGHDIVTGNGDHVPQLHGSALRDGHRHLVPVPPVPVERYGPARGVPDRPHVVIRNRADTGQAPFARDVRQRQRRPGPAVPSLHGALTTSRGRPGRISGRPDSVIAGPRQPEQLRAEPRRDGRPDLVPAQAIPMQGLTVADRPHVSVGYHDRPVDPPDGRGGQPPPALITAAEHQGAETVSPLHRDSERPRAVTA